MCSCLRGPQEDTGPVAATGPVVYEGVLRRKKEDHGTFEDPYKMLVAARLRDGVLRVQDSENGMLVGEEEHYNLRQWRLLPRIDKPDRFSLTLSEDEGDYDGTNIVTFRAESKDEGKKWVVALRNQRTPKFSSKPQNKAVEQARSRESEQSSPSRNLQNLPHPSFPGPAAPLQSQPHPEYTVPASPTALTRTLQSQPHPPPLPEHGHAAREAERATEQARARTQEEEELGQQKQLQRNQAMHEHLQQQQIGQHNQSSPHLKEKFTTPEAVHLQEFLTPSSNQAEQEDMAIDPYDEIHDEIPEEVPQVVANLEPRASSTNAGDSSVIDGLQSADTPPASSPIPQIQTPPASPPEASPAYSQIETKPTYGSNSVSLPSASVSSAQQNSKRTHLYGAAAQPSGPSGVGIVLKEQRLRTSTALVVNGLAPRGPADLSGLIQIGDILLKVDGKEVDSTEKASKLILGERGSKIAMAFKRFNADKIEKFTVHMERGGGAGGTGNISRPQI